MNSSFSIFFENENEDEQQNTILRNSEGDEECSNVTDKFYEGFQKEKIEKISTTDEIDDDIYKVNQSNVKRSNKEFNFENNKKFENKKKKIFKTLKIKKKRNNEKDAKLKKNITIFKKILAKNINEKIEEIKNLKRYKLKNKKISLGLTKTKICNNFNKSLIEILNDENIYKDKNEFNIFFNELKKIKYLEYLDIYKIFNQKLNILYKTLYLDLIEDDDGLNIKKETSYNFEKFNLEKEIIITKNKKITYNNSELNEYLKDFKKFIFNFIDYLNNENKYQKNQQLKTQEKII